MEAPKPKSRITPEIAEWIVDQIGRVMIRQLDQEIDEQNKPAPSTDDMVCVDFDPGPGRGILVHTHATEESQFDFHAVASEPGTLWENHLATRDLLRDAYSRAELIIRKAIAQSDLQRLAESPQLPLSEYSVKGQVLVNLFNAAFEASRLVLLATFDLLQKGVGLFGEQLWLFLQAEMRWVLLRYAVTDLQRACLEREFKTLCMGVRDPHVPVPLAIAAPLESDAYKKSPRELLDQVRLEKFPNLSKEQFAVKKIGVSVSTYYKVERGEPVRDSTYGRFSKATGIPIASLTPLDFPHEFARIRTNFHKFVGGNSLYRVSFPRILVA